MMKANWAEESDEDEELSAAAFPTTFEWNQPSPQTNEYKSASPWNDEYNTTPMPPSKPPKLRHDDVMELLSHAMHGRQKNLVLKQFKVVLPYINGKNEKLSPPQYEYPEGIYILVSPLKHRHDDANMKGKDKDMTWDDYYALLPPHLQSHVWRDSPDKMCSWSLSGPQCDTSKKPRLQQRYCYPHGRDEYANTKGASLWTTYDKDHQEIYSFRILHVYFSAKRAKNKKELSLVRPPARPLKPPKKKAKQRKKSAARKEREAELKTPPLFTKSPPRHGRVVESKRVLPSDLWSHRSPEADTHNAVARLDATMPMTIDSGLDWGMGSPAVSTEEKKAPDMKMPGASSWDYRDVESLRPPPGGTPWPYHDLNVGAAASSPEDLDSLGAFDWNALDYLDGYTQGPYGYNSRGRVYPQPVAARAHHPFSPPRGVCVLWDPQTQSVVRPVATSPILRPHFSMQPASVTQSFTHAAEMTTDDSMQSTSGPGLSFMFEEPDNYGEV